ncbi:MAG: tRNA (guanosine(37)-N1)-methyltransferase TrmD [Candidatus Campbellbacteria bacterium]|nr:tRNA (guanosine(37)-N1)-methyltransferase TrmD [Candidatus Campbellbacteria bacterium]
MSMHFHIITLFPDVFKEYLNTSIIGRAVKQKSIKVSFYNPIDFSEKKGKRIDKRPYGGGPGMVIEPMPVLKAFEKAVGRKKDVVSFFFTPSGEEFTSSISNRIRKKYKHIILISGHYEGIDARVQKITKAKKISVGRCILTGGELPAMFVIDAISRHLPNVLGNPDSIEESRVSNSEVYTRPEVFCYKNRKYRVPKVLLSGHHGDIDKWKKGRK